MIRPLRIDNALIEVPDVDQAANWYKQHVGLVVVFASEDIALMRTEDRDGPGILLRQSAQTRHGTVWFEVSDAQLLADIWRLPVFAVATGLCVEIQDPWGNTVGFTDYSNTRSV